MYRGVHGAYWALIQGDLSHCGVTVHEIDSGIDTGAVLAQDTITIEAQDNFTTYPYLQLGKGLPLLISLLKKSAKSALSAPIGAL